MLELLSKSVKNHFRYLLSLILTLGSYFTIVFWRMLSISSNGLYAGHEHVWSDWSFHVAIANIFAFKSPEHWFSYHPLYAGGKFTYPFLTDMVSGIMMRFGLSIEYSFFFPSVILAVVLIAGLYFLFYLLTDSKKISVVAVFIFFLSAGLGFIDLLRDLWQNPSWSLFLYSARDYGRFNIYQWYAGNMAVGLMVPQRAFLIGTALGVWAIAGTLFVILREHLLSKKLKIKILVTAGVLAGILPIAHAHSFIAVVAVTGLLCLVNFSAEGGSASGGKKWRMLWPYVITAGIISSVLYMIFISGGIENKSFFQWHPGYTADGDFFDWLRMWSLLWGVMPPIAIYGLYANRRIIGKSRLAIYIAATTLFAIGNLYLFQPIAWDNSKIFWWVYLIFSAPTAMALGNLWSRRYLLLKMASIIFFVFLTFLGFVELMKLIQTDKHEYQMTGIEDINLGLKIRASTDPLDVFLTAPSHNHFVMVWGLRPILMGYTAWVWNFGFDYNTTEMDMKRMYLGGDGTKDLLKKYDISYVVIGPTEIYDLSANEKYFSENFSLAFRNNNYRIYDTRSF
ncbi:MAG: hypothetical protein A3C61_03125 [Candidatus Yanofskybacteria bacterium RIFCSPHIGHO2_02_FULL_39_10]|uniref:Glycosyltransferase RgtA/B/C/D-like domain-containing protein n=1 Tax=Candidatus Yanofskybacteria bacterium RIFCSPHIGHO2_02_FULL_39_10 TaxID=1802674 RepID=A0A1F8FAB9_9BACT|nr:MAG: hypothetical protein A3C61_03125 [Candidatus Yanofskybacteria bacterium RIFCSPHIGHO2_02_FULL_39_10]